MGNHDKRKNYTELFDEIYDGPLFISARILLSHEPVYGLPWCVNIHGHDHSMNDQEPLNGTHVNLAANVCGYRPVNLGKLIKDGLISEIPSIHRFTIDMAIENNTWRTK